MMHFAIQFHTEENVHQTKNSKTEVFLYNQMFSVQWFMGLDGHHPVIINVFSLVFQTGRIQKGIIKKSWLIQKKARNMEQRKRKEKTEYWLKRKQTH